MRDLSEMLMECEPLATPSSPKYEALAKARELKDLGFDHLAKEIRDRVLMDQKMEEICREKYPVVTPKKIKAFLNGRAAEYNERVMKTYSEEANRLAKLGPMQEMLRKLNSEVLRGVNDHLFGQIIDNGQWTTSSGSTSWTFDAPASDVPAPASASRFTVMTQDFLSPAKDRIAGFAWVEVPVREYEGIPPDHALRALKVARGKEIFHDFCIASVSHVKDPLLLGVLNGNEDRYFLAQWGDDIPLDDVI